MPTNVVEIPDWTTGTWTADPVHSTVSFIVRHMMISKVRGDFRSFEATIVADADPLRSSVTATIDASSVDTGAGTRDDHLRSADFLDVHNHPTITYRSTGVRRDGEDYILDGELTIRGVTRQVPLHLEFNGIGPDVFLENPDAGKRAGFSASGEINRMDFGVSYNGPVPGGGVFVSEKVTIVLEVQVALTSQSA